jgi:hypothetical protein
MDKSTWSPILKEWLELADNMDDKGRDSIERLYYGAVLGEAYGRGDISIHFHIRWAHRGIRPLVSSVFVVLAWVRSL